MRRTTVAASALLWASACGGEISQRTDGGTAGEDATVSSDGGLLPICPIQIAFVTTSTIPGTDSAAGVEVAELELTLESFRLIGDTTSGSGSEDTTVDELELEWSEEAVPSALCFDTAPAGRYQEILFRVKSVGLDGVMPAPDSRELGVDDEPENLQVTLRLSPPIVLDSGETVVIPFEVDLSSYLERIVAEANSLSGPTIEIPGNGAAGVTVMFIDELREALGEAFDGG